MGNTINDILHAINSLEDQASMAEQEANARSRAEQEKMAALRVITEELQQNLYYSRNKLAGVDDQEARFEAAAAKYGYEVEEIRRAVGDEQGCLSELTLKEAEGRIREMLGLARGEAGSRQLFQLMAVRALTATGDLPNWLRERVGDQFIQQLLGTEPSQQDSEAAEETHGPPDISQIMNMAMGGGYTSMDPARALRDAKRAYHAAKDDEKKARAMMEQMQIACGKAEHRLTTLDGTMTDHATDAFHRMSSGEVAMEEIGKCLDKAENSSGAARRSLIFKAVQYLFEGRNSRFHLLARENLPDTQALPYYSDDPDRVEKLALKLWEEHRADFEQHVQAEVAAQQALFEVQRRRIEAEAALMLAEELRELNVDRAMRTWGTRILTSGMMAR